MKVYKLSRRNRATDGIEEKLDEHVLIEWQCVFVYEYITGCSDRRNILIT